jgi:hypothetical protein
MTTEAEMSTLHARPLRRVLPVYAAAVLAFASALVSLYWTLGGTLLLDTVGGTFEDLARQRSGAAIALGILVVLFKVVGGLLALALVQPWGVRIGRRLLLVSGVVGSVILVLDGGVYVLVGGLVVGDVITPSGPVNEHVLRWHVRLGSLVSGLGRGSGARNPAVSGRPLVIDVTVHPRVSGLDTPRRMTILVI